MHVRHFNFGENSLMTYLEYVFYYQDFQFSTLLQSSISVFLFHEGYLSVSHLGHTA